MDIVIRANRNIAIRNRRDGGRDGRRDRWGLDVRLDVRLRHAAVAAQGVGVVGHDEDAEVVVAACCLERREVSEGVSECSRWMKRTMDERVSG